MKQVFLVVDLGGNSRIAVVGVDGELLAIRQKQSEYYVDSEIPFGGMSFDAEKWKAEIFEMVRETIAEAGDVEVIAVSSSSQREGIVLIGNDGESLIGYPNSDFRGAHYMMELNWPRIIELTALTPIPLYSALKFMCTMRMQPETAAKTKYITSISDWAGFLFTGQVVWERSQAMHSAVYEIAADQWSDELCEIFGIDPQILPPLAYSGDILGTITPEIAAATGISEQAVFIVGGADTQMAIAGTGAELGDIVVVNGTTTPVVAVLDTIQQTPCWISPHVEKGQYMLECNAGSTGSSLDALMAQLSPNKSLAEIDTAAAAQGLPACMALFSMNMFVPNSLMSKGAFLIDNPIRPDVCTSDYVHALLVNIAFQINDSLNFLAQFVPTTKDYLVGTGGGFSGQIEAQALADASGKQVRLYKNARQSTVFGCVVYCCRSLGLDPYVPEIESVFDPAPSAAFTEFYADWLKLKDALQVMQKPLF
jgi:autoinducer 2 (AI-2) kinase